MCVECGVDEVAILESKVPRSPTEEERAKHELTHLPFQNWCEICVKTKANTPPHFKRDPSEKGRIPRLSMDYMFMPIGENSSMTAIMVLKDSESKQLWSRIVDKKGSQAEGLVKWIAEIIKDLGYSKLKFRSDQEASIKDVQATVISEYRELTSEIMAGVVQKAGSTIIPEHSGVGDSQGNGDIEEAVRRAQKQIRAIKGHIEKKTKRRVPDGSPM